MPLDFEKHAVNGTEFVRLVAEELELPLDAAGKIISSVLHALRNRLTHEESFQLLAKLPIALKGMYVDGWKFDKDFSRIIYINDFLDEVKKVDGGLSGYDFKDALKARTAVAAIFKALNYFVSEEEMNDIMDVVSIELKKFIKESISGGGIVL